jgi:hypothetical protein
VSKGPVFNTEAGLELYANSFYDVLPGADDIFLGDDMSDYIVCNSVPEYLTNSYDANQSSGWDWEDLRNINYFIENCTSNQISTDVRQHYIGLARFFRAVFYFNKVKRFGDVPWVNKVPEVNDDELLYAGRDSRTLVMDSVLADLNFACEYISIENDDTRSLVTKWVARAFKSRVCLFEGTFRKYHTEYSLEGSADKWLKEAADAALDVMDNSGFALNTAGSADKNYRQLFISADPVKTFFVIQEVSQKKAAD